MKTSIKAIPKPIPKPTKLTQNPSQEHSKTQPTEKASSSEFDHSDHVATNSENGSSEAIVNAMSAQLNDSVDTAGKRGRKGLILTPSEALKKLEEQRNRSRIAQQNRETRGWGFFGVAGYTLKRCAETVDATMRRVLERNTDGNVTVSGAILIATTAIENLLKAADTLVELKDLKPRRARGRRAHILPKIGEVLYLREDRATELYEMGHFEKQVVYGSFVITGINTSTARAKSTVSDTEHTISLKYFDMKRR